MDSTSGRGGGCHHCVIDEDCLKKLDAGGTQETFSPLNSSVLLRHPQGHFLEQPKSRKKHTYSSCSMCIFFSNN